MTHAHIPSVPTIKACEKPPSPGRCIHGFSMDSRCPVTDSYGCLPTVRHYFHVPTNDPSRTLCGATTGSNSLVRMTSTNVNCDPCLDILENETPSMQEREANIPEKMYLVCRQCGEAFDSIVVVAEVHNPCPEGSDQGWDILPESEAM